MSETSAAKNQEDEKITPRSTSKNDGEIQSAKAAEESTDFSSRISERTTSSSGSFAERLAARGKSVATDRPNTARFKSMPPSRLPISRPNCINLPPGLSPTTLLDSPVLLSTSQSEPSPTTGTFPLHPFITWRESRGLLGIDPSKEMSIEKGSTSDFLFKPFSKQGSRNPLSPLSSLLQSELQSTTPAISKPLSPAGSESDQTGIPKSNSNITILNVEPRQVKEPSLCDKPLAQGSLGDASAVSEQDQKVVITSTSLLERSGHDGYNWRKYGKKQVKGSEHPRNYYKCTHPNCNVKKKVKQAEDGQIMEIVYEGSHIHPKPQLIRRMHGALWESATVSVVENAEVGAQDLQATPAVQGTQSEGKGNPSDKSSEVTISAAKEDMSTVHLVSREGLNGTILAGAQIVGHMKTSFGADVLPDVLSPSTSGDGREDAKDIVPNSKSPIHEVNEEEIDLKRRKLDKNGRETAIIPRTSREPRVVVETTSSVDILEDGYRWRKYGQKNVKGNPNPRSYYKCTNAGCPVRKQVERSSENFEAVITSYEGKHNHDIPAPRNSGQDIGATHAVPSHTGSNVLHLSSTIPSVSTVQDNRSQPRESSSAARSICEHTYRRNASNAEFGAELVTRTEGNVASKDTLIRVCGAKDNAFSNSNTTEGHDARFQTGLSLVKVEDDVESAIKQEHLELRSKGERDNRHTHGSSYLFRLTSSSASALHQSIPPRLLMGP